MSRWKQQQYQELTEYKTELSVSLTEESVGCEEAKQPNSFQPETSPTRTGNASVTLLYYPAYKSVRHFFGHVAVNVEYLDEEGQKKYLPGFDGVVDWGGRHTLENTAAIFGKPVTYQLPPIPKNLKSREISTLVRQLRTKEFSTFSNNCSNGAANFLDELGYRSTDLQGVSSTPVRLVETIKKNHCLETAYRDIMNYNPRLLSNDGKKRWDNIKNEIHCILAPIFSKDGKFKLNPTTMTKEFWLGAADKIAALREKYKEHRNFTKFRNYFSCCYNFSPPTNFEKLTRLLNVVEQYADPANQLAIKATLKEDEEAMRSDLFNISS